LVPQRRRANGLLFHNYALKATRRDCLASACVCYSVTSKMTSSPIGTPEGKTGDADYQPNRRFLDAKNISKQVRDGVRDPGLVEEVPGGCYEHSEPNDASHSIE